MSPTALRAVNFVAFQVVWLLSLVGAGSGRPWLGAAGLAVFLAWHFRVTATPGTDLRLLIIAGLAGLACDTLYIQSGLLAYSAPLPWAELAPFWIVVMWMNFAVTLNASLGWLQSRPAAAALFGAIGGPLAYWAGVQLGAARITADPLVVFGALALSWAIAVPLLLAAARRLAASPLPRPATGCC